MALYPIALRDKLGLDPRSTTLSFGLQVGNYRQLKDAIAFLREHNHKVIELPAELYPGIDYSAFAVDPDGNLMQLYWYMERVGWDGRPRPASRRRKVEPGVWPETLDAHAGRLRRRGLRRTVGLIGFAPRPVPLPEGERGPRILFLRPPP